MNIRLLTLALLAACGGDDDDVQADAPPDVPAMIMVTGTAKEVTANGTNPVMGVTVGAFANSDENTAVAMATTDAQGNYTLMITTNGKALDGYVKATKSGLLDTYLYAPSALVADFAGASVNMVSQSTFDALSGLLCRATQDAAKGTIAVQVNDATGTVGGATIASTPAATNTCYNGVKGDGTPGLPSNTATATASDGIGYLFNVTGEATVSATKSGGTFKSHKVTARPGTLTTTIIAQ